MRTMVPNSGCTLESAGSFKISNPQDTPQANGTRSSGVGAGWQDSERRLGDPAVRGENRLAAASR